MSRWQNALLPGELREGGGRSPRDWLVDGGMLFVALTVGVLVLLDTHAQHADWALAADVIAGVVALASLVWRRSRPEAVGLLASALSIGSGLAAGPAVVAAFNAAVRGSRRGLIAVVMVNAVAVVSFPLLYQPSDGFAINLLVGGLLVALVFGWGVAVRAGREQVQALRERADALEAEGRLRVEQARDAERRRIAREMHDVLAHRLSLLALHAGALEYRGDEAAGVIRETARAALEDLRGVIGVLRDGGEGIAEPPQPTLLDLGDLVAECRAAGMRVDLEVTAGNLPDGLGRTAYRIVQEGLTNARKHAPGAAVDVRVTGEDELRVVVRNRRPVGVAGALPGAGSGLVGLEERVALAGGSIAAGPDADGDFVIDARLPWSES